MQMSFGHGTVDISVHDGGSVTITVQDQVNDAPKTYLHLPTLECGMLAGAMRAVAEQPREGS